LARSLDATMAIYRIGSDEPIIPDSALVASEATLIGKVTLGEFASVWPGAVIRGDDEPIHIGARTNVQDGAVLHTDPGCPLRVGDHVTVGHQAVLHGCTIGDGSLIGIQAVVYNRAVIGKDCLIGAGSLVTEGKVFPDRSLIVGVPAKLVRRLTDDDVAAMHANTDTYVQRLKKYRTLTRID
jgi:carbonic anhydrase/acetyltransferase-like protein (isoleucine patch superfamily)